MLKRREECYIYVTHVYRHQHSIENADDYTCESGMCSTLPFFLTIFIISPFPVFLLFPIYPFILLYYLFPGFPFIITNLWT
jgi:hypothetical protein